MGVWLVWLVCSSIMAKAMKAMKAMGAMKAMKVVKAMKVMKAMKAMRSMKAMKTSIIARGRMAKCLVFRGSREHTVGGLKASDLMKNKHGKVVSKKRHNQSRKSPWMLAVAKARKALNITGFCAVGGTDPQGKALYAN